MQANAPIPESSGLELQYPDNQSEISTPSSPQQALAPRPRSPPTVYLHPAPAPDAQARRDRQDAWTTKPNYGGWGDDKVRFLWRFIGRTIWFYIREDWVELPLSWDGVENRDTSMDNLDVVRWAELQLHRCSPHAADYNVGPPTFTGPQVLQRSQDVQQRLTQLETQSIQLSQQKSVVDAEITRLQVAADNLKDLDTLAHGLRRD
ncbi:hypothetical protein V5O48_013742 [Marasmius crinis-equi]|uniref:Uncharacterized protein n=1 Tax=Marasmius crinis-equi TaxID=585013 RepID=A0ABR3EZD0_9AGAR